MAWIEVHQSLPTHRKTLALADHLNIKPVQVVGHIICFWLWAVDNAPQGDLSSLSPRVLSFGAGWEGDPQIFVDGLQISGFIDVLPDGTFIHDWYDYAGRLIEARKHQASQKRIHRDLYNDKGLLAAIKERDGSYCRYCRQPVNWADRKGRSGATYDFVDPDGPTELDNVVVACRACNAGKNQRTPEQAGYPLLEPHSPISTGRTRSRSTTVPDPTVPDPTPEPINTPGWLETLRGIEGWAQKGEVHLESLLKWAKDKGWSDDQLERSAIGLASVQEKTLKAYTDMAAAFQRRLNQGYDVPQNGPGAIAGFRPGQHLETTAEAAARTGRRLEGL